MAELIQQEPIAREVPLHSEELFHLLKTLIQGEAPGRAMQFAQRLHDKAVEELVTPSENFVAAAFREPDLAEEVDRADEVSETEVDEETSSLAQQRQLLRAPINLGTHQLENFCRALPNGRRRRRVVRWVKRFFKKSRLRSTTDAENSASSSYRSGRHSRDAAKRGNVNGILPWMRSRCCPTSDLDSVPKSTTEATGGDGGWRTGLHTQTQGWSPRMVWTWRVRLE